MGRHGGEWIYITFSGLETEVCGDFRDTVSAMTKGRMELIQPTMP